MLRRLSDRPEDGASAVEYGLIVAAIAALIVVAVFLLGGVVNDMFTGTCENIVSEANAASVTSSSCTN